MSLHGLCKATWYLDAQLMGLVMCLVVQGDEDFEKCVEDGESALTWIEDAAMTRAE